MNYPITYFNILVYHVLNPEIYKPSVWFDACIRSMKPSNLDISELKFLISSRLVTFSNSFHSTPIVMILKPHELVKYDTAMKVQILISSDFQVFPST